MSIEQTEGIVLKSVDFSETSLILSLYTRRFGKLNAIAKGGRRLKGSFETSLDVLANVQIGILRKKNETLDILTESKLIQRFCPNSRNLAGLYAGYILVDLVREMTEEGEPNPELFALMQATLNDFALGSFVQRTLIRFEWIMLDLLGMKPVLDRCVECHRELTGATQGRIAFGPINGGILCSRCRVGLPHLLTVRQHSLAVLQDLIKRPIHLEEEFRKRSWRTIEMDRSTLGEIRRLTTHTVSHLAERRPELYSYLGVVVHFDHEP